MKDLDLFNLVADRNEQIRKAAGEKTAIVGALGRAMLGAGKAVVKNPLKAAGTAGAGLEVQGGFAKGSDLAARSRAGVTKLPYTP